MNRREAEDYVYKSYLKAEKQQDYNKKDEEKRKPQFSKEIIRSMSGTPSVAITGSKGKGSVSCMISQILQSEMKVGMMTSPHIVSFNERFKIDGVDIQDEDLVKHIEQIKKLFDKVEFEIAINECISPMGIQAALALSYFNENKTDFNIFELGKGAKYDDVNNVKHDYSIINTIFLEHTRELGRTLSEIADNKSAIINGEQKCVYIAEQDKEVMKIIKQKAYEYNVELKLYGRDFYAQNIQYTKKGMVFDVVIGDQCVEKVKIPLLGEYQAKNCTLAMALCMDLLKEKNYNLIKEKLALINWPGRLEIVSSTPFILLDACINKVSCNDIKSILNKLQIDKITLIMGIPDDKDYIGVAESMDCLSNRVILTKSTNPHYIFTDIQNENLKNKNIFTIVSNSAKEAIKIAETYDEPIVILGTTSLVSDIKNIF